MLAKKGLLVRLSVRQWIARKLDKAVTEQVAIHNQSATDAGRYHKSLLPSGEALRNIHQKTTLIRKLFYANTLPWTLEGIHLLPSKNYMDFMTMFKREKAEWLQLCDTFFNEYASMTASAKISLGKMYNKDDYPPLYVVQGRFDIDMEVSNVPQDDFRVEGISDEEMKNICKEVEARVTNASAAAMKEAWERLYNRVHHMHEKLSDPKAVFRDTLVENTREICEVLKRLNFNDDPNLENLRQEVEISLANHHPDALRNDPDLRRDKSEEAKAIMAKMKAFMGSNNG